MTLDSFKTKTYVIDNIQEVKFPKMNAMQGEKDGRSLTIQVKNGGIVEPQPSLNLNLGWKHRTAKDSGGKLIEGLDAFKPIDREKGMFRIEFASSMMQPGIIDATIQFIDGKSEAKTEPFIITVTKSPFSEDAVQSESSFTTLQEALATVSDIDGKINSIDIKKANKEDLAALESTIAKIPTGTPKETFASLAELQSKYPNGANFAVVVLESDGKTGYVYLWNNNTWQKGALYQAQALADDSVTNSKIATNAVNTEKVSQIDLSVIKKSWAINAQAMLWNGGESNNVSYSKVKDELIYIKGAAGDFGVMVPVVIPGETIGAISNQYLKVDIELSEGHSFTGGFDIWVLKKNRVLVGSFYGKAVSTFSGPYRCELEIPQSLLTQIKNDSEYKLLFAVHGGTGSFKLTNLAVSNSKVMPKLEESIENAEITSQKYAVDFFRYQDDYTVLKPADFFSNQTYKEENGVYEIWWEANHPGIRFRFKKNLIEFGKTVYFVGRARKTSGANASLNFNIFSNTADTLGPTQSKRLSTEWETFVVPVTPVNSNVNLSDNLFALIQITTGDTTVRVEIDNPRLYLTDQTLSNQLFSVLKEIGYKKNDLNEMRYQLVKGQSPNFSDIEHTKIDASKAHFVTTAKRVESDNMVLDTVEFYLEAKQNVQFAIGSIDQNNLLVESQRFQLSGTAGYNSIKVEEIPIGFGERLFMDISTQKTLYQSAAKVEGTLVQDEDHAITGDYSGMIMYESEYMIPLNYSVRGKTVIEQVNGYNQAIQDVREEMNTIKSGGNNYVKDRNGKLYSLLVNEDRSITPIPIVPKKFRIFGNSLTKGFTTFGMAASSSANDFAAKLLKIVKKKQLNATMERSWISNWESATTSAARQAILDSLVFTGEEDLVIIQLGDNVNNDEKRATFAEDARTLVRFIQSKEPNARIAWVNGWYNYNFCYPILEEITKETDMILIDIRDLAVPAENKSKIGNTWTADDGTINTITDSGVASHPGDLGMARIAERIALVLGII